MQSTAESKTIEDGIESQELSQQIQDQLDDATRLHIAKVLKAKIQEKIKSINTK